MGRELFDYAFKQYAKRWAFKHPEPADFFRTMEDASGEDLDWFWRGWFYSTDACDIAIDTLKVAVYDADAKLTTNTGDRTTLRSVDKPQVPAFDDISKVRNRADKKIVFATDADTTLRDFYWRYARGLEPYDTTRYPVTARAFAVDEPTNEEKQKYTGTHLYEITFSNKGGLVMPIIVELTLEDSTKILEKIPAQIWRKNEQKVTKVFATPKKAIKIVLDPMKETADIDEKNNVWPKNNEVQEPSRFALYKASGGNRRNPGGAGKNPMQAAMDKK